MQAKFFEFKLDNKQNEVIFKEAINALNELIDYYQEIENSNDTKLTIKLETPWDRQKLWGGDSVGIGCRLLLKPMPEKHPLLGSLNNMGFEVSTYEMIDNTFSGIFSVYDARFIAEIPEKCQSIIGCK